MKERSGSSGRVSLRCRQVRDTIEPYVKDKVSKSRDHYLAICHLEADAYRQPSLIKFRGLLLESGKSNMRGPALQG